MSTPIVSAHNILRWDILKEDTTVPAMAGGRLPKSLYSKTYSRFLKLMKRARTDSGLTQVEVAKRLGRPQSFVSKYESGERRIDVAEFLAICQVIQTDPTTIVRELSQRDRD